MVPNGSESLLCSRAHYPAVPIKRIRWTRFTLSMFLIALAGYCVVSFAGSVTTFLRLADGPRREMGHSVRLRISYRTRESLIHLGKLIEICM